MILSSYEIAPSVEATFHIVGGHSVITGYAFDDRVVTAEGYRAVIYGRWTKLDGTAPIAAVLHDYNDLAASALTPSPEFSLITALAEAGYVVVVTDAGGNVAWNADIAGPYLSYALDRAAQFAGYAMDPGITPTPYLVTFTASGHQVVVGATGMGAITALAAYGNETTGGLGHAASLLVLVQPIVDLASASVKFPYSTSVASAFGGGYSDSGQGATHNPLYMAATNPALFSGLSLQVWYGQIHAGADPYAGSLTEAFLADIQTHAKIIDDHDISAVGIYPDIEAGLDPGAIVDFAKAHRV